MIKSVLEFDYHQLDTSKLASTTVKTSPSIIDKKISNQIQRSPSTTVNVIERRTARPTPIPSVYEIWEKIDWM